MVLFQPYVTRVLRRLHYHYSRDPVNDEWRGWNWDRPPLRPRGLFNLTMSDVVNEYCPTRRDVWIKHLLRKEPRSSRPMQIGKTIHTVFHLANSLFLESVFKHSDPDAIYNNMVKTFGERIRENSADENDLDWCLKLFKKLAFSYIGYMCTRSMYHPHSKGYENLLWITEHHIDGSVLGLSKNIRVDASFIGLVVEFKYGLPMEFHKHALAGYALVLEAEYEIPFNYGLIVYVNNITSNNPEILYKPVYINTVLRTRFIEKRDEVIDMLFTEKEPVKPLKQDCLETCPYYYVCWGEGN